MEKTSDLNTYIPYYFITFAIYGFLREIHRIRLGVYPFLNKHSFFEKGLFIFGNIAFLFSAYILIKMFSEEIIATISKLRIIYMSLVIPLSEELTAQIISRVTIRHEDYALASMIKGFILICIFFILSLPIFLLN